MYKERIGLFTFFLFQLTHFYWSRDKSFLSLFTLFSRYTLTIFSPSTFVLFISKHYTILYHTSHSLNKCRFSNLKFSLNFLIHKCIFLIYQIDFLACFLFWNNLTKYVFVNMMSTLLKSNTPIVSETQCALKWSWKAPKGRVLLRRCSSTLCTKFWERSSISND